MVTLIDQNTLRAVEDGLVDAINLVADELTFIFFPDEYARNNNDDWTIDDRSVVRSEYTRDTRDTRETYSTKSSMKGWKKVILKAKNGGKKSKRKSEEAREGSVDSHTRYSDKREEASSIVDKEISSSLEEDVMDLFTSETEDVESPPAIERREDASLANSASRPDADGAEEAREVIDLCDAEEVIGLLTARHDAMTSHLGESTVQRLERLRTKREQLRQERERWENQYNGIPFDVLPQEDDQKDNRPEPQGDYDVGRLQSEAEIVEFHGHRIQDKVQELSRVLDQIMIKKLNGEFPDNPETRAMEAEIRANLLEFQRWWQPPNGVGQVPKAPPRPES